MTQLVPNQNNQLQKLSCADSYQVKSISKNRFLNKIGNISEIELDEIISGEALCVGFKLS